MKPHNSGRTYTNLSLVGFMGTGKSTLGRAAALHLGFRFLDTDEWIESRAGKSISRIFAEEGEAAFRAHEAAVALELEALSNCVISTGGGFVLPEGNLLSLRKHSFVVCLWAPPEVIYERVRHQHHRPLLQDPNPMERIRRLLGERSARYGEADLILGTGHRTPRELVEILVRRFQAIRGSGPPQSGDPWR